mmetsp:Transcript_70737/g.166820  ORF Transcript_70737/g.166820 Transcript_70737/m.166820 type:complete len:369 (-) Transcript_70737:22-1128(-)
MAIKPGETEGKAPGSSSSTLQWSATLPESHGGPAELGYVMLGSTASTDEGGNYNGTGDGTVDALLGVLLKAFPVNIVDAAANKNFLGIVVFSASFGLAAAASPRGAALLAFFDSVNEAVLLLVHTAMWYAPFGIASLIIGNLGATDDLPMELKRLYIYILTVLAGLATHAFVFLPAIYFALLRRNPYKLMRDTSQAILTGLGTASSAATLPVSMSVVQKAAGVSARAAKLVMPLGATVNMSGTALYEAVAAVFIAQVYDVELSPSKLCLIAITSIVVSVGATGIPEAGLITMILVLEAAGLPAQGIQMIVTVDFLLDRCRTAVNIWGDIVCATVVDAYAPQQDDDEQDENAQALSDPLVEGGKLEQVA